MTKRIKTIPAICRTCSGDGRIWQQVEAMPQHIQGKHAVCPQCLGSGMVNVRIESTITITPKRVTIVPDED